MHRSDLEALFLQHLPAAEKILGALGRRHALSRDDAEEFAAWARLRLIENDYAVIAKFRGESSMPTYLTVVLSMLYREYCVQQWGRWRPSAAAKRRGGLAVRLETLMDRDRLSLSQAGQLLRTSGATTLSDRELGDIAREFPMRAPLRPVQHAEPGADAVAPNRADDFIESEESVAERHAATQALNQALDTLPDEERLIVRLHYMEAMSVADIARGLALPQKPLYRRLERALGKLRSGLERAGVSREHVRALSGDAP